MPGYNDNVLVLVKNLIKRKRGRSLLDNAMAVEARYSTRWNKDKKKWEVRDADGKVVKESSRRATVDKFLIKLSEEV